MEKPSPQVVGREFVRQYYTLLHRAPEFLHRLYGRNSSFSYGGLDSSGQLTVVCGREEIRKMIVMLQFKDCYAQISHVDAHATLGDGIVVQVLGKLSTNGQPMRKFMQTVVLAAEGSGTNKFYIYNDIVRYEVEALEDSEAELDDELEDELEVEQDVREASPEPQEVHSKSSMSQEPEHDMNGEEEPTEEDVTPVVEDVTPVVEDITPIVEDVTPVVKDVTPVVEDVTPVVEDVTLVVEGTIPMMEDVTPVVEDVKPTVENVQPTVEDVIPTMEKVQPKLENIKAKLKDMKPSVVDIRTTVADVKPKVEDIKPTVQKKALKVKEDTTSSPEPVVSPPQNQEPPGPVLWSTVLRRNLAPIGAAPSSRLPPRDMKASSKFRADAQAEKQKAPAQKPCSNVVNRAGQRDTKPEVGNKRFIRYPDSHQVFIGNLPLDSTEEELKNFFSTYGHVVTLWINPTVAGKISNYGFITFDGPETVQRILKIKPIIFRKTVRLTVAEKKPKTVPEGEARNGGERRDVRPNGSGSNAQSFRANGGIRDQKQYTGSSRTQGGGRNTGHRR